MLFQEASRSFINYAQITHKDGTLRFYKQKLRRLSDYFGNRQLEDINHIDIINFISDYKETNPEVTNATINKYIQTLKVMRNVLTAKPLNMNKLKEEKRLSRTISDKDLNKIFEHYTSENVMFEPISIRNHLIFRLLLDTGLRINELLNLKVEDVIMKQRTIHVKVTKTSTERYVYFTDETANLMKKYAKQFRIEDYIFIDMIQRKRLSNSAVQNICARLEKRLKLSDHIRPHKWRHTFATNFLKSGGDIETLRLILGHTNLLTTQRYLHIDNSHVRKEYQRIIEKSLDTLPNYSSPW